MIKQKVFFRYILKEMGSPFFLGLFIFTFVLLMNQILRLMDMIINKGIGVDDVGALILFSLPSLLVLTVPIAMLLAILITLGRLNADSEIIAMKASGISLYQMLAPFAAWCLFSFVLSNLLTLFVLPRGNSALRDHIEELVRTSSEAGLEEGVFNEAFEGLVIYINTFDRRENRINGILVSDKRDPAIPTLIIAEHAVIVSEDKGRNILFNLSQGSIHRLDRRSGAYQYALFETYAMNIQPAGADEEREPKYRELHLSKLFELAAERKRQNKSAIRLQVEINKRFAFPFACLVFGLLGVPLGVYWRKGGRSYGFVLSILIVFFYYLLLNIGENMAKSGYLFVFMGIWLPNVLLGSLGIYFFKKVAAGKPLALKPSRSVSGVPVRGWFERRFKQGGP